MGGVVVVDDDAFCAKALAAMLTQLGKEAVCVSTGDAALDLIESRHVAGNPVDACLMDVHLAREKGYEVVKLLRRCEKQAPELPRTRVVGLSGDESSRTRSLSCGMDDFLSKPTTPEKLRKALHGQT